MECVPNFSEGKDEHVIQAICDSISSVEGAVVLHRDIGPDAHRTVITFAATAEVIVEAAFKAIETATTLIDMRKHHGEHPRMGATDVCPFIPLQNISMKEVIFLSRLLAQRVATELSIPIYLYEASATDIRRSNLAYIRKGEYEAIETKLKDPEWTPDFGSATFNPKAGMTAIGARDFLVAFNVSLDTKQIKKAQTIAKRIRESGFRKDDVQVPGRIKGLKAIGWIMPSYECAQVSMNIVDVNAAPIQTVYEAVKEEASRLDCGVLGSELIGLMPLAVWQSACDFYGSTAFHSNIDEDVIYLTTNGLGLNYLSEFRSSERILENLL